MEKKKLMGLPTWVLDFVFIPFIFIYISVYMALRTLKAPFFGAFSLMIIFKIYTANMSLLHNVLYLYEVI